MRYHKQYLPTKCDGRQLSVPHETNNRKDKKNWKKN